MSDINAGSDILKLYESLMDILTENKNFTLSEDIIGPLLSAVFALEMVAGLLANLFVISVTFFHPKSWKQSSTIFLANLLLADLVLVIVVLPFGVISTASGEWIFGSNVFEKYGVCQFTAFMMWYGVLLVTMTLAVISFDRFLFIVKPFAHKKYMKPYTAVIIVVIVWISCAILNTTPLYGLGKFVYAESHGNCVPGWEGQLGFVIYSLLIFTAMVGTVVVTSVWTYCFTRKFIQKTQTKGNTIYVAKKHQLFGIFGTLLLAYVLCFAPGFISSFLSAVVDLPPAVYAMVLVCYLIISVANPIVQSCFRPDVKNVVFRVLSLICPKCCSQHIVMTNVDYTRSGSAV